MNLDKFQNQIKSYLLKHITFRPSLHVAGGKTVYEQANKAQKNNYSRLSKYRILTMTVHLNTNIISGI